MIVIFSAPSENAEQNYSEILTNILRVYKTHKQRGLKDLVYLRGIEHNDTEQYLITC